ncbi:MAG: hypothetical protein JW822_09980 [Spirochaetales bacterium]|nr:hypothetical protein [Spirochaetales bacterium]
MKTNVLKRLLNLLKRLYNHKKSLFFAILFLASIETVLSQTVIPRLLELDWGISPSQADETFHRKNKAFNTIAHVSGLETDNLQTITKQEQTSLSTQAVVVYYTEGKAYFDIPVTLFLYFFNSQSKKDMLELYKAEVHVRPEQTQQDQETLKTVFRELMILFMNKYNIVLSAAEEKELYNTYIYNAQINDVAVEFEADFTNNKVIIIYEKGTYKELIAKRQEELDSQIAVVPEDDSGQSHPQSEKLGIQLLADLHVNPFIYNTFENSFGNSLHFNAKCGIPLQEYVVGGLLFYDYASFDGLDPDTTFHGAWAILGAAGFIKYQLSEWLILEAGAGASWRASAFEYDNQGVERKDELGLLVFANGRLLFFNDIILVVPVRVDVYFGSDAITPLFYAGLRAEFTPFNDWIILYGEIGTQIWSYSGVLFESTDALFLWSLGAAFDLSL